MEVYPIKRQMGEKITEVDLRKAANQAEGVAAILAGINREVVKRCSLTASRRRLWIF